MGFEFDGLPLSESERLIDFEQADLHPGIVPGTWILVVSGSVECSNFDIRLRPRVYVTCPDYWAIEVVASVPGGYCLPAVTPYVVSLPLAGVVGAKGIEVIGASKSVSLEISGGCEQ